ncbi:MAG: hypothetical protein AAGI08_02190 [Bacteroidota bacterium]
MSPRPWLALGAALVLVGFALTLILPSDAMDGVRLTGLSDQVIADKIARKQAKLRGEAVPGPEGRAEWRRQMRAGATNDEIRRAFEKSVAHLDAMPVQGINRDGGVDSWTWIGPGNVGGRVRAIDIDPDDANIMHLAAVGGGVWRTTDAGANWYPVNDFLPRLAVVTLARAPGGVLYAGTGEGFSNIDALPGEGIYKSTDNGVSWSQLTSTDNANFQFVNRIAIDPTNASVVLAATSTGIRRSTNAGSSWGQVQAGNFVDVKFHPNERKALAATQGFIRTTNSTFGDVYSTLDGGATWTQETTGAAGKLPTSFGRCEVNVTEEFADEADVWTISCDRQGGASEIWRAVGSGTLTNWRLRFFDSTSERDYLRGQGWYDNALWVSRADTADLIVGGIDLFRSTNSAQTLTKISDWRDYHDSTPGFSPHSDQHFILEHPDFNGTTNKTIFVANDGGIQRTNDFETVSENAGWANLANNLGVTQFYYGASSPNMSVVIGGAQDNSVLRYRSADGPQNWFQAFTGDGTGVAVDPSNPNILYSSTQYLCPNKSTDGGATWSPIRSGIGSSCQQGSHPFVPQLVIDPSRPDSVYAGSARLYRTNNGGSSWTTVKGLVNGNRFISAIDVSETSSNYVAVGYTDGRVEYSTDAGATWTRIDDVDLGGSFPTPPNAPVTSVRFSPDLFRLYATFGGYAADRVWSFDAYTFWRNASGSGTTALPPIQVNTVEVHPTIGNWLYAGTDIGLLASEDAGATWSRAPRYPGADHRTEGPVNTEVADLLWAGDRLIAVTHGRGMYWTRPTNAFVYVDDSNPATGSGTFDDPYRSFQTAYANTASGGFIYLFSGTYDISPFVINKEVNVYKAGGGAAVLK